MALNQKSKFRVGIRKKSVMMRVVRPWYRLPKKPVGAPSLKMFRARLDGALESLI